MVTSERLATLGVSETMRLYSEKLTKEFGWTTEELCDESRNRMHASITEARPEERMTAKEAKRALDNRLP
jgi:hypothetical protein